MWFLRHFPDRHAKFWNIVAFPLAPEGFAQARQHQGAFVLDRDHQVVFFYLIVWALKKHPDGPVGTFGDENRVAGFDVDGLPRLVQIQAEGFLHYGSFHYYKRASNIGRSVCIAHERARTDASGWRSCAIWASCCCSSDRAIEFAR